MTTAPLAGTLSEQATRLALAAGTAAASVLPAAEPVQPGEPRPGAADVVAGFAGAVVADLEGVAPGDAPARFALLVGQELVAALAGSPLGGLDLAAAVQPTVDAVATALGGSTGAAREVELELVVTDLAGPFTAVPLVAGGPVAAVLLPDALLGPDAGPEPEAAPAAAEAPAVSPVTRGIELLHGVDMEVTVELGRTRMTVRDLLALSPGAVLELDRAAGSPADLLVNGRLIARGEVVVVDEDFGLRVTEIVTDASGS